jgi:hypothetical protein
MAASGLALAAILTVAALGSIAAEVRIAIGSKLDAADRMSFRLAQHLLVWAILPVPVFHASMIWGGFVTSPVVWRHIHYVVDRTGRVIEVSRRPYSDQQV